VHKNTCGAPALERNTKSPYIQVRFNKSLIVLNSFFILNLVLMPMKAYITESLPWRTEYNTTKIEVPTKFQCMNMIF